MILFAIGTEIAGWPNLAAAFYIAAILLLAVVYSRADLFRLNPKTAWSTLILSAVGAMALWAALRAEPQRSTADQMESAVEKVIAKTQRIELKPAIHGIFSSSGGIIDTGEKPHDDDSPLYLIVGVSLINSGTIPTTAHGWRGMVEIEGKGAFEGLLVGFSKNNQTLSITVPDGRVVTYSFEDFITVKATKPIVPGETLPGLLMFRFEQLVERDVVPPVQPTRFCLRFHDSQDTSYDKCFDMLEATSDLRHFMVPGLRPELRTR